MEKNDVAGLSLPTTDPVCGMRIETIIKGSELRAYGERTYLFCSADCAMKFDNDAEAYVAAFTALGDKYGRATSVAEEERALRRWLDGGTSTAGRRVEERNDDDAQP
jgi:YHS domain-containing protein